MTFSGLLLDKLNFRPCGHCLGIFSDDDEDINSSEEFEDWEPINEEDMNISDEFEDWEPI